MNNKITIKYFLGLALFIFMTIIYYRISQRIPINSDTASGIIEGFDISNGNFLLKNWSLSTVPFYFTDLIWYAIAIKFLGLNYLLSYIIPAILLSLLCVTMISASENKAIGFLFTLFFIGSPVIFLAKNIVIPVIHVGTYLYCVLALLLSVRYVKYNKKNNLVILFLVMTLTYFSDGIAVCIALIPSVMVVLVTFLTRQIDSKWLIVACVNTVSFLASKAIWVLFSRYGFEIPYVFPTSFATVSALYVNISDLFEAMLRFSGSYFFGMDPYEKQTIWKCISFFILILLFIVIASRLIKLKKIDSLDIYLLTATLIMPIAFSGSTIASGISSARYILPFFIFGVILAARHTTCDMINFRTKAVIAIFILCCSVNHIIESIHTPKANNLFKQMSQDLSNAGLKNGFADFWFSSSISLYGQVQVSPVHYDYTKLIQKNWLSKKTWYKENNNFVIIHDEGTKKTVLHTFGEPARIVYAAGMPVYVWNKKITANN